MRERERVGREGQGGKIKARWGEEEELEGGGRRKQKIAMERHKKRKREEGNMM